MNATKQQPQSQFPEDQGIDLSQDTDQSQCNTLLERPREKILSSILRLTDKQFQSLQLIGKNGSLTVEKAAELSGTGVTVTSRRFRRLWGDPRLSNSLSPEDRLLGRRPLKGVVTGARQNANEYFLLPDVTPELIEQAIAQYKSDQSKEEDDDDDDLEATPELEHNDPLTWLKLQLTETRKQVQEHEDEATRLLNLAKEHEDKANKLNNLAKNIEETIKGLTKAGS